MEAWTFTLPRHARARAHTHTHTLHFRYIHSCPRCLLHTPTCTPSATHLSVDIEPVRQPRRQAEREPGLAEQSAFRRHPFSPSCLFGLTATAAPDPTEPILRRCALSARAYSKTHILEGIFSLFLVKSHLSEPREDLKANSIDNASFEPPSPHTGFPLREKKNTKAKNI